MVKLKCWGVLISAILNTGINLHRFKLATLWTKGYQLIMHILSVGTAAFFVLQGMYLGYLRLSNKSFTNTVPIDELLFGVVVTLRVCYFCHHCSNIYSYSS